MNSNQPNTKKIRVLHIVLSMETGGLENGIVNLINRSDTDIFQVDILCLRRPGELIDRITNENTHVFFDTDSNDSLKFAVSAVRKHCLSGNYDILHSHGWVTMLSAYLGHFFTCSPKLINGEHGTLYFKTYAQRLIQKKLFSRMDLNLSVCAALKDEVIRRFNLKKDNFKPIVNGVDVVKFQPNKTIYDQKRKELNIPLNFFVVGSVGRLVQTKNYPSLIRAFSLIKDDCPDSMLVLIGDGPDRKGLEMLIELNKLEDRVKLLGRRDDVPDLINTLDAFVLPSFREGLSNTVLEAMACGKPALVTNVGGNPEIVIPGVTGYLLPVDDDSALAQKILDLYVDRNLLSDLSLQARKHVVNNLSLEAMVTNYEDSYKQVYNT